MRRVLARALIALFTLGVFAPIASAQSSSAQPGLAAEWFFESTQIRRLGDIEWDAPDRETVEPDINWAKTSRPWWTGGPRDRFAVRLSGSITIPESGQWDLSLYSDDGAEMWINDEPVVRNDGLHSMRRRTGRVQLEAGTHDIQVYYFENGGQAGLIAEWRGPGIDQREVIPASAFTTTGPYGHTPGGTGQEAATQPGGGGPVEPVYYVRKTGRDLNSGRSPHRAFRTLAKAVRVAKPGDTVYIGAGEYAERIRMRTDGTASEPIRFVADTSGAHTGDGGVAALSQGRGTLLDVRADYIEIEGLHVLRGSSDAIRWENCVGGKLINVTVESQRRNLRIRRADVTAIGCSFQRAHSDAILLDRGATLNITESTITNAIRDGIRVAHDDSVLLMERCVVTRCHRDGIDIRRGIAQLINCLVVENDQHGLDISSRRAKVFAYNSSFIKNHRSGLDLDRANATVVNCIIAKNQQFGIYARDGRGITLDYNIVHDNHRGGVYRVTQGEHGSTEDPRLGERPTYRPEPDSPAIDAGLDLARLTDVDIEGLERPGGGAWDIGCYEFAGDAQGGLLTDITETSGFGVTTSATSATTTLFADLDADGDLDAIVTGASGARLLRNRSGVFGATSLGHLSGQTGLFDADNDGDLDLWGARVGGDAGGLLLNDGRAGFVTHTGESLGFGEPRQNDGAAFIDIDANGRLDVIMFSRNGNHLGVNVGSGEDGGPPSFSPSLDESDGFHRPLGIGDGSYVASADVNGDRRIDALYHLGAGAFFRSNEEGTYDRANAGLQFTGGGTTKVGIAWADYDNDGDLDCLVGNRAAEGRVQLFRNSGGFFGDVASSVGLDAPGDWISGAWGDYDNDGDLDLVLVAGNTAPSTLYANNGDGTFSASQTFSADLAGADAAFADYDNDGDLDLALTHQGAPAALYENGTDSDAFLKVRLIGAGVRATNAAAIGVRVDLLDAGGTLLARRDVGSMGGLGGQSPLWVHFGGVDAGSTYQVRVHWATGTQTHTVVPSAASTSIGGTTIAQLVTINEPDPPPLRLIQWQETDPSR